MPVWAPKLVVVMSTIRLVYTNFILYILYNEHIFKLLLILLLYKCPTSIVCLFCLFVFALHCTLSTPKAKSIV